MAVGGAQCPLAQVFRFPQERTDLPRLSVSRQGRRDSIRGRSGAGYICRGIGAGRLAGGVQDAKTAVPEQDAVCAVGAQGIAECRRRDAALCRLVPEQVQETVPAPVRSLMQSSFAASRSGVSSRARPVMANARRNTPDGTAPATARVQSPPRIASRRSRSASASSFASRRQGAVRLSATRSASPAARRQRYARWYAADLRRFSRTMASRCAVSIRTSQKAPRSSRFSACRAVSAPMRGGRCRPASDCPPVRRGQEQTVQRGGVGGAEQEHDLPACLSGTPRYPAHKTAFPGSGASLDDVQCVPPRRPALNRAGEVILKTRAPNWRRQTRSGRVPPAFFSVSIPISSR